MLNAKTRVLYGLVAAVTALGDILITPFTTIFDQMKDMLHTSDIGLLVSLPQDTEQSGNETDFGSDDTQPDLMTGHTTSSSIVPSYQQLHSLSAFDEVPTEASSAIQDGSGVDRHQQEIDDELEQLAQLFRIALEQSYAEDPL